MPRRVKIVVEFEADIDEVPGWGHELKHWERYVTDCLRGNKHYNPTAKITSSEIHGEPSVLGILMGVMGRT